MLAGCRSRSTGASTCDRPAGPAGPPGRAGRRPAAPRDHVAELVAADPLLDEVFPRGQRPLHGDFLIRPFVVQQGGVQHDRTRRADADQVEACPVALLGPQPLQDGQDVGHALAEQRPRQVDRH